MTKDLTQGDPLRCILSFCVPLIAGNLFQQFYNLADSVIVGRLLGVNAFAAVGSTGSLNFLVLGFAMGICSGLTIPIAQSFGAKDFVTLRRRAGQGIWVAALVALALTALTYFATDDILRLIDTPAEIFDDAYAYIFHIFMGTGALVLYNLSAGLLRALGDGRTPLIVLIAAVVLNIVLDIAFIAGLGMGVEGAAYATVLSQALSGLGCVVYIWRKVPLLHVTGRDMKPNAREMAVLAGVGVPMGLQYSITAVGSIILQSAVNSLGAAAVAAMTAGSKVTNITGAAIDTMGLAMATYCGQNRGAGRIDRIRVGVRRLTAVAMLYCAAAFVLNYFCGTTIALLFLDESETAILSQVHRYLVMVTAGYPMLVIVDVFRNSLQGLGYTNSAMFAGVAELLGRSVVAFGLVGPLGFTGVCLAHPTAWLFADVILLILYFSKIGALEKQLAAAG